MDAYNRFIQTDGNVNYFSIDRFYDVEMVKTCYQSTEKLKQAYNETGHFFEVEPIIKEEIIGDKQLLRFDNLRSDIKNCEFIVDNLNDLHKRGLSNADID